MCEEGERGRGVKRCKSVIGLVKKHEKWKGMTVEALGAVSLGREDRAVHNIISEIGRAHV